MPKIACLTPLYFSDESCIGGGERYPLNLSQGIVQSTGGAYTVEILSFGPKSRTWPIAPGLTMRVLEAARPPQHPLDVVSWELPSALVDADLVHIHQAYTRCTEMAILVAKQQGKPVVVTDHGGPSSTLGTSVGCLEMVDHIISYSDFGKAAYRVSTPITVVKGGVDGTMFTPPARRPERDRILYVGRLLPHKAIDRLITACPADIPLTVCGRPYNPDYFEMLKKLAVGKDVQFVTDADDDTTLDFYRRSWATVLPSVYRDCYGNTYLWPELMGFTLLESMCCGTPAICSDVAAMPEFIIDGVTGFVFKDLPMLTDRIRRLASDPVLVETMGARARREIDQVYDLRVAGARFVEVYEPLIARARGVAA
ncbi:glycosyltransferase family 4 protein [Tundrisphaera sp. TA3]|uniref:glycosyltransferase family 4 protein n=1 Tax=Tundrisphaera sp. TA3 TaxID=3435775 RepID=UPI003EBBA083